MRLVNIPLLIHGIRRGILPQKDEILNDLPIEGIMKLAEESGSLDFLKDEREDVYTVADLKVRYK